MSGVRGGHNRRSQQSPGQPPAKVTAALKNEVSREEGPVPRPSCEGEALGPDGPNMDGGAWWAAVHGVAKSQTRLSDFTFTFHFHALEKDMATHSSVLAWRIPGMGSLVGCPLWGRTESDTTEAI